MITEFTAVLFGEPLFFVRKYESYGLFKRLIIDRIMN